MNKKYLVYFMGMICLALFLLIVLAGGYAYYLKLVVRKDATPKEIAEMERFLDAPLNIPDEWLQEVTFPNDLVEEVTGIAPWIAQAKQLSASNSPVYKAIEGEDVSEEDWGECLLVLKELEEPLALMRSIATHPDYKMEVLETPAGNSFIFLRVVAQSYQAKAHSLAREGRIEEALAYAVDSMRLGQHEMTTGLVEAMIGVAIHNLSAQSINTLAAKCEDPALLREVLKEMTEIHERVFDYLWDRAILADLISTARLFPGSDVAIAETGADLMSQFPTTMKVDRLKSLPIFERVILEQRYLMFSPNTEKAYQDVLESQAKFDLIVLRIAQRIYELETGEKFSGRVEDLANILPEEPFTDPYSHEPYIWDESEDAFYCEIPGTRGGMRRLTANPKEKQTPRP